MTTHVDIAVIGGGQAGLATSYELSRRDLQHVVLDAAPEPGHAWRSRWDSLRLFTPAWFSALPGMPFPGDPTPTRPRTRSPTTSPTTPPAWPCLYGTGARSRQYTGPTGRSGSRRRPAR